MTSETKPEVEGLLLVVRAPHGAGPLHEEPEAASPDPSTVARERFVALDGQGRVTGYNGHVDLGTGIRTALAQIVAEELDVAVDTVDMVLGHTGLVPNQGGTIASETIQVTAVPLRQAAARARAYLVNEAAKLWELAAETLTVDAGVIRAPAPDNRFVSYGDLVAGRHVVLGFDAEQAVKDPSAYRVVGHSVPRTDIPAKATGTFSYVHDVRVPGMLHGRVVRPPYAGIDVGPHVGNSLVSVDEASVAGVPGLVAVVVIRDFVGVVCEREEDAARAAATLEVVWTSPPSLPDLNEPERAIRANPSRPRVLLDRGDVDAALAGAAERMTRSYVWPYQMHGAIGPSCAVADVGSETVTVWSGTQSPLLLRADLALLLGRSEGSIGVIRFEAAGCYGRNCADDVSADAVLLSRAVGRPVRVQLTREQEHLWEPKGTAQVMDVDGGLDAEGRPAAYDFATRYPSNGAPTLALLLTGTLAAEPQVFEMGDRTAIPPYRFDHARVTVHDMAPIARASWLRGVSSLPNSFAHESYIDELAVAAGVDPIAYRLRVLDDPRARDLVEAVAERAGWVPHAAPLSHGGDGTRVFGRGFAYAVYVHGKFPGTAAAWSAWVADVAVDKATGVVEVTRVVVGQDAGLMINPNGIAHQVHGNVIQSTSRVLKERVTFDSHAVASREWGAYPIITFPELPAIDVVTMHRPNEPPLGAGESASVPSAAAIANAIFDATGLRFREPPFTPERVLAVLDLDGTRRGAAKPNPARPRRWWTRAAGLGAAVAAGCASLVGIGTLALPWRPAFAPVPRPDAGVYSAATIARGRLAAAAGDCAVCHGDQVGGLGFAGGRAIATPFGTVYASNISPDPVSGIGSWSYPAFERAMRQGISRDGHHLYPAHPYPSFAKVGEADLEALYAFLMAEAAVPRAVPPATMRFPFSFRPLMAGWNALFLKAGVIEPDPARSDQWNRGRSLVEGLGHCSACHSPRNLFGAEQAGAAHLGGGTVDGWHAPSLTATSLAPLRWTYDEYFAYLRTGSSRHHGVAAGPMAEVVAELGALPDVDLRAMATYLASLSGPMPAEDPDALAAALDAEAGSRAVSLSGEGARLYGGACAACHEADGNAQFGARPNLAFNTSVAAASPDNLLHVVLDGIAVPAHADLGAMPAFRDSFSDRQVADLLRYLRARFAPEAPAWEGLEESVSKVRGLRGH